MFRMIKLGAVVLCMIALYGCSKITDQVDLDSITQHVETIAQQIDVESIVLRIQQMIQKGCQEQ